MNTPAQTVSFNVSIVNPCLTTLIDAISFDTNPLSIVDGQTGYTEWDAPATALDTSKSNTNLCGTMSFAVFLDENDTAFTPTWTA